MPAVSEPGRQPSALALMPHWALLLALGAGAAVGFARVGLPSPVLFGCLVGAMLYAIAGGRVATVPRGFAFVGQAAIGTSIGALVDPATLTAVAQHGLAVGVVCLATIGLSLLLGQVLRLHGVAAQTATLAFIAGGAAGVVAVSKDLGADERVVSVVQYLRVVLIVVGMPLVTKLAFQPPAGQVTAASAVSSTAPIGDVAFTTISVSVGLVLARVARLPAGAVLGPLAVAVAVSLTGVLGPARVPELLLTAGFAVVGLDVGLAFTRDSLGQIARLLPTACALILALVTLTAGFGVVLAAWTGTTSLDGYLATTPGGLFAVLPTAADSGADVTFVLAVQVLRLLLVMVLAPVVAGGFRRAGGSPPGTPSSR